MAGPAQRRAQLLRLLNRGKENRVRRCLKELQYKKARVSQLLADIRQCPPRSHQQRSLQTAQDLPHGKGMQGAHLLRTISTNSDVECILRAKTIQLYLTGMGRWTDPRNFEKFFNVKWNLEMVDMPVLGLAGGHSKTDIEIADMLGWSDPVSHDCGSFVECGATIMPHSPAFENWKIRSFTSIQMVHTHTYIYI